MAKVFSGLQRFAIRFGAIFWFTLLIFGLLGLGVLYVLPWWMLALIVAAGIAIGLITYFPRWLLRRNNPAFSAKRTMLTHMVGGVLAALGSAALPFFYMAFWVTSGPTALPLATLTNGKKTIIFQGMQHVGSEDFYKSVVFDLEKALTEGYTLFYEGVQPVPGRPDLTQWFNETLLGNKKDLSAGYTQLANSCGLTFQLTYFEPLLADKAIHPARHVTADVTYGEMKAEFDRLMREDPAFAQGIAARAAKKSDEDDSIISLLSAVSRATRDQQRLVGILCRGFMGMSIAGAIGEKDATLERVILDYRNRALARFVAESPAEKIYITYGAAHFPGFLKDLQALDPAMTVQSLRWVRPMSLASEPQAPRGYPVTR
ncbi:MAG: hypothetical protein K2X45_13245 [Phreatobacter sp.]|nr:hypothetical protein [Phreatobacter sp.]